MNRSFSSLFFALVGGLFFASLSACSPDKPTLPLAPADPAVLPRGFELVNGLAACGFCHSLRGEPETALGGGRLMRDRYGDVVGPNITPSRLALAKWSESDVVKLLRSYERRDGSFISLTPHAGFEWLSDTDVRAIAGYLKTVPAVDNTVERRFISGFSRNTSGILESTREVKGAVPDIRGGFSMEYGAYLVDTVARCGSCHSTLPGVIAGEKYLGGGQTVYFDGTSRKAPNISQSKREGIGSWSASDLLHYLQTGVTPQGKKKNSKFCPTKFFARAKDSDLQAIVKYLRSVPANEPS
jgi:mono/diheme cytochrome c family protein